MTDLVLQLLVQGVTIVVAAAAVYGGVRADVRHLIARQGELGQSVRRAHERLDNHLADRHAHGGVRG